MSLSAYVHICATLASAFVQGAPLTFTDVTAGSGLSWAVTQPQVQTGIGVVVFDHDGDGDLDLILSGGTSKPITLFRNKGELAFSPVPGAESGLAFLGDTRGIAAADWDNDGDLDLVICSWTDGELSHVLRNDGGHFVDVTATSGVSVKGYATHAAFGDYDNDGFADFYVGRYYGRPRKLYRNLGDGTFTDVALAVGLTTSVKQNGLQAAWYDLDRDGDLDLLEMNDRCYSGYERNLVFVNQGDGTFLEQGAALGLDLCFDAMGAAVGDLDLDGFPDIYMTNVYYGHTLVRGRCGGFDDVTLESGANALQWGWGVALQDFDDDGLPDLYIGHESLGTLDATNRIFHNLGGFAFDDVSATAYGGVQGETFAVVAADLDGDLDLDLVVGNLVNVSTNGLSTPFQLLRNDTAGGHRLRVRLVGVESNRDALGAWVSVLAAGQWRHQLRYESLAWVSRAEGVLHFGLGDVSEVDRVVVRWPSGTVQVLTDVPADEVVTIEEAPAGGPVAPLDAEICGDGIDNDCNGVVDDGPALGTPCAAGIGACAASGVIACAPDLAGTVCTATPSAPGVELCGDSVDNDCDGQVDQGYDIGAACTAGTGACAAQGTWVCAPDGLATVCSAAPLDPTDERCGDNVDDDCDGETDEGFDLGATCVTGLGACAASGVLACADGVATCLGTPAPPGTETCNGIDDDCDGATDEGLSSGAPCSAGIGACLAAGTIVCSAAGTPACNANAGSPNPEACNGVDDDCDGAIDDGLGLGAPCVVGVGACAAEGIVACALGNAVCDAAALLPVPERCDDAADNDCDGLTDEGFDLGALCEVGIGECSAGGVLACIDGDSVCHGSPGAPLAEACNALDDDCDGLTDEGFELGVPCSAGTGACIAAGVTVCSAEGDLACSGVPSLPQPEACNALDDDCDGLVDDGFGVGAPCTAGVGACAAEGVTACGSAGPLCTAIPNLPAPEACNGIDDDCDGSTDEGFGLGTPCGSGVGACARLGALVCDEGGAGTRCNVAQGAPTPERCGTGLDEDCDGKTDEGFDLGAPCAVGVGACRATGVLACESGSLVCSATPGVVAIEIYGDDIDNDCDGRIDDVTAPSSSCSASGRGAPGAGLVALALVLGLAGVRRRRVAMMAALLSACSAPAPEPWIADIAPGGTAESTWHVLVADAPAPLRAVWSGGPGELWIAGDDAGAGPLIRRRTGGRWHTLDSGARGSVRAIAGSGEYVLLAGEGGLLVCGDRATGALHRLPAITGATLHGAWGPSAGDLWAVGGYEGGPGVVLRARCGDGGEAYHVGDLPAAASPTARFLAVAGTADEVLVAGDDGTVLRFDGQGWTREALPIPAPLAAAAARGLHRVVAGGFDAAAVFERSLGDTWAAPAVAGGPPLSAVAVDSTGRAVGVGAGGALLHRTSLGWARAPAPPVLEDWHAVIVDDAGSVLVAGDASLLCFGCAEGSAWSAPARSAQVAGVTEGDFPLALGRIDELGSFVTLEAGDAVEIVQGPQGGIHVEVAIRLSASGLPAMTTVEVDGTTLRTGVIVGAVHIQKLIVTAGPGGHDSKAVAVIFDEDHASAYLDAGDVTVCLAIALSDGRAAKACVPIVLVDVE